ncbi:MAG: HAD family hydrolase [Acidobacteriaceae bacterium]|nr:HAD family hydrolase [Acidobacteriaceae bacterium]
MRYFALASDYDGTLAHDGAVGEPTVRALERLTHSGRKLILVTGRELPDLQSVFPRLDLCERVVAENGAVLYNPATREKTVLAERPPESFVESLRKRGVNNISIGDVIIATWHPFEQQAVDAIREAGLELQIIFNKEAVMILPSGTNKMTGLCSALEELKLSPHNVVGVGDAENDHAFLSSCECAVAVANAIPALKERADFVTEAARGAGVAQLIEKLIENDASEIRPRCDIHAILIGKSPSGDVWLPGYARNLLICGQSGSGKSTLVTALLERMIEKKYQICLLDPEGDYENLPGCRTVGDEKQPPSIEHVKQVLEDPGAEVVVNMVGVPSADRPVYFSSLISEIQKFRLQVGRPHWLVIDEAHHVLPREWAFTQTALAEEFSNLILITVHPEHVSPAALRRINTAIFVGREPRKLMNDFGKTVEAAVPDAESSDLPRGEALLWQVDERQVIRFKAEPPRTEHLRHRRKYAEGQLEGERRFRFRGPQDKMDLFIQNLNMFVQVAEGIDAETWQFHLKRGDYSNWIRNAVGDSELADQIAAIEKESNVPDAESRKRIKEAILQKYTAPA